MLLARCSRRDTGYAFKGKSDCEIVIALYQLYGTSFLKHLRGEFALCLYDSRTKTFLAARDRYGIKPLLYAELDGALLVAAEVKAFAPLGLQAEWDVQSVMARGYSHDQRTIFKGVSKVCQVKSTLRTQVLTITRGEARLLFSLQCLRLIDRQSYWDLECPDKVSFREVLDNFTASLTLEQYAVETRTEDELVHGVRERLLEAVRIRLQADVRVGIFSSDGIDSSVIAGMVAHLVKEKGVSYGNENLLENIHCYCVGFDEDSGYDESGEWHSSSCEHSIAAQKAH
jgi:asparagine synthase (glutamine-hydrolysing)